MRKPMLSHALFAVSLGAALSALCLLAGRPAAAQSSVPINTAPQLDGDIRAGILITTNNTVQKDVGRDLPAGGADFVIHHNSIDTNTIISGDYIYHTENGNHIQVIPVTIGQQIFSGRPTDVVRTYTEYGAGLYFVNQSIPDNAGFEHSAQETAFGGFFGVGLDLTNNVFVDARYHAVTNVNSVSASGFELTGGIRF